MRLGSERRITDAINGDINVGHCFTTIDFAQIYKSFRAVGQRPTLWFIYLYQSHKITGNQYRNFISFAEDGCVMLIQVTMLYKK